jgi:hypothetical protein
MYGESRVSLFQEEAIHNGSEQVADGEIEPAARTPEAESVTTEEKEKEKEEDNKTKKEKKEKVKKKWSFRSISFSKKDKSKLPREDKNGDVTKEEVAEVSFVCAFSQHFLPHLKIISFRCSRV